MRMIAMVTASLGLAGCSTGSMIAYAFFCRPEIPLVFIVIAAVVCLAVKIGSR